ncbi:MAG: SusC/RagA family TonB-linked outer membrane protein, partial [Chitinophagaceae bacterium]
MGGGIFSSFAQETISTEPKVQVENILVKPKVTKDDSLSKKNNSQKLDEVVVTAMGITRSKRSLGYAAQDIKADEMNHASNPNIATALQGKVAGVQITPSSGMPGASSLMTIRGARFFTGNNQPLYVVDGLPIASTPDFNTSGNGVTGADFASRSIDINPMDIESMSILKGPAAAALYGMRASNGAIIITTKSGKQTKGKPMVTFSTNVTADQISRLPKLQSAYAHGAAGKYAHIGSGSWGPKISELSGSKDTWWKNATTESFDFGGVIISPGDSLLYGGDNYAEQGKAGMIWVPQAQEWQKVGSYNNPKEFFQTGYTWNTNINVSQAIEQGNYSFSAGNTTQNGIIPNTGLQRYTFNGQGAFNLNKYWKMGFSGNISSVDIDKIPSGNDSYLFGVYSAPPNYNLRGIPYHIAGNPYIQTSYRAGAVGNNPYWMVQNNQYKELTRRFFGNAFIEVNPLKWLSLRYRFGGDFYNTRNNEVQQSGNYSFGGLQLSSYDPKNLTEVKMQGGRMSNDNYSFRNLNSLFLATAHGDIGTDWTYEVLLGNEVNDDRTVRDMATGLTMVLPGYNNMDNMLKVTGSNFDYQRRTIGTFTNVSFSYLNMLYLNATGRWDMVSSMPSNNRNYFYPSVSTSFVFTELDALGGIENILNFGKIRASYAQVGQAASSYYTPYYTIVPPGSGFIPSISYPLDGVTGYQPSTTLYDPNLKPQNVTTYEVGTDLQFFKNLLGVS